MHRTLMRAVVLAIFATGSATIMGSVNYVTTVINMRAPGMKLFRMPLVVWSLFITAQVLPRRQTGMPWRLTWGVM